MVTASVTRNEAYRAEIREFLRSASPPAEVRRIMELPMGYEPSVWREMIEMGYVGRHMPKRHGGGGATPVELGILMEELGAALTCVPMLSTTMALAALAASGDDSACAELIPAVVGGHLLATVAATGDEGHWTPEGVAVTATTAAGTGRPGADLWRLDGHANYVVDGHIAGLTIVTAHTGSAQPSRADRIPPVHLSLFLVDGQAQGLNRELLATVDKTRRLARVTFDSVPARLLGGLGQGEPVFSHTLDVAATALAAEQAGGAGRCMEMAVEYAGKRKQFGRPIGSFQTIAHRCAEMLLEVESARAAARHACSVAATSPNELPVAACMAKACSSDAYAWVATENIQVHGGIGFTWDHDAHLYFRRAKSSRLLFGDPRHHRALLADRLHL